MLTMFKRLASLVPTPAANKVTLFVSDTGIPSYKDDAGLVTPMSGQPIPAGYIDGLKMEWVSGTQIRFTSGSAYIPSLGRALALAAAVTKSPSLAASTWYHAYLYSNGGTPDVEVTTTAPDTPYSGTARTKTGDTSRRYIGSFRTDAAGAIINFRQSGTEVFYLANIFPAPFQVLANGNASTATSVSCSAIVPETARIGTFIITNSDSSIRAEIWNSEGAQAMLFVNGGNSNQVRAILNAGQALLYTFVSAPTGNLNIRTTGYQYER
ncbi:hypothetical protein [Stenotrophomonas sp.]|uniref:hypothetical protein n=1 Tax=Stenotrophomonas sp. TaxID=69392 RepID=UPI0028B20CE4|nr:hypothetical protein [Stenotrophomonas sp.]